MSVKKNRSSNSVAAVPRSLAARAYLTLLMLLSMSLIVLSQTESPTASRVRIQLMDVVAPVIEIASKPLNAVANIVAWVGEMSRLRSENIALKNSNAQLLQWQTIAKNMEAENSSLRTLMNVVSISKNNYITTRIVTDVSGPYVRSALIGGGMEQGIKKDQAVISEQGLVGRVVDVGDTSSRVLLLGDINSRIPVMGETSHEKTILVGNNSELPTLSYITADNKLKVGERIITSGDGGVFPRGIAVGVVIKIEKTVVYVQPFVDANKIDYVSVVDYTL